MRYVLFALTATACLLSAPLAARDADDARDLALAEAHAGPPTRSARFISTYDFQPLGGDSMLLWESRSRAYLVKVDRHCFELESAMTIGLRQHGSRIDVGTDAVVARGQECQIREIRELDVPAYKEARKLARAEAKAGS